MKKTFLLISFSFALLFASCTKTPDQVPDVPGDVNIRYVNTIQGSIAQDFYANDVKQNTTGLTYGNVSAYSTIPSGKTAFTFYDAGTAVLKSKSDVFQLKAAINVTVFNYLDNSKEPIVRLFAIGDDMSAPASGKAKVRFLHVNRFGERNPITVNIVGQTTALSPLIEFGDLGHVVFHSVDPGAKFTFSAAGVTEAAIFDPGIVAGKNYTIWIDGSAANNLTGHVVL